MRPSRPRQIQCGFTLVEACTALAVTGVLAAAGVPQLTGWLDARAADAEVNHLATALRLARSEAMKRGEPVTVCARDRQSPASAALCAPSGKDWSAGWVVFVDRGQRGRVDDEDLPLKVHQAGQAAPQVRATLRFVTFQATGVSLNAASHFDVLPRGRADVAGARRVCVNKPGRLRALATVTDCAA